MAEKEIPAKVAGIKFVVLISPADRLFTVRNARNKNQFPFSARRVRKINAAIKIPKQRINVKFSPNQFKLGI